MSERKILHLSDLHISGMKCSMLQKSRYCECLFQQLNTIENMDTCVISGDLVDKGGTEDDYKEVESFLESLKRETDLTNFLIVPGNHDVNRNLLGGIIGKSGIDKENLWKYHKEKLQYYLEFINKVKLTADCDCALISNLELRDPDMMILGLNSTYKIGMSDGVGYIDIKTLKQKLSELFEASSQYEDYMKIAVFHHRPIVYESEVQAYAENNDTSTGGYGMCDYSNWQKVKQLLLKYNVHTVLTGHVHGTQSSQIRDFEQREDDIYYSTVGSIGVNFNYELLDLLGSGIKPEFKEKMDSLNCYVSVHNNHNAFNILTFDNKGLLREEQYKFIVDEGRWRWILWKDKEIDDRTKGHDGLSKGNEDEGSIFAIAQPPLARTESKPFDYEKELLNIVRENKLYKTGHFHWKGVAMLNWIDSSYLFNKKGERQLIAAGICDIIKHKIVSTDCIIGIGIKGSIMLSYIRFQFPEIKCSYYPDGYVGYNSYEKELFPGIEQKMSSITLLTDVVHSGNTIKNFISHNEFLFSDETKLEVITIFNASDEDTINLDYGPVLKVPLHYLAKLKVANCTGSGENCTIYTQKLAPVYEYKEQGGEENI